MPETNEKRQPWVAVALSLGATELGDIYCGQIVKGLVLFFISFLYAPLAVLAAHLATSTSVLLGLILSLLFALGVYLYAVVDAHRAARAAPDPYPLKDYNRTVVYVLFLLV